LLTADDLAPRDAARREAKRRVVEQTRKLIEQEQVLFLFSTFGTPTNTAILSYTNARHVPEYVPRRDRQSMGRSATLSL